jgi:hypothetical protein
MAGSGCSDRLNASTCAGPGWIRALVLVVLPVFAFACSGGGDSSPTPTGPTTGTTAGLSFKVDGVSETAGSITAGLTNGILSIGGTDSSRSTTLSFAVTPTSAGTGTYTFGPASSANALILVGNPASSWQAGVGIGSGTVTITSLTSTSAAGSFSFSLVAVSGSGATGTKAVTEGVFNVTFTAGASPAPTPNGGNTFSTLIDGVLWNSSLSRRATLTNNILTITGQDTNFRVITLAVPVSGGLLIPPSSPLTVSLDFGPGVRGTVSMVLGSQNWDNGHDGGTGTFTVTSISSTRVAGTFTVTLVNNPINVTPVPTARLTSGQFDMTLERF